jgi:hypothetical protein
VNWMELVLAPMIALAPLTRFLLASLWRWMRTDESLLPGDRGSGGEQPEHAARSPPEPYTGSSTFIEQAQAPGVWSCS